MIRDQNGDPIKRNVKRSSNGLWGCNVWSGRYPPTNLRRYFYKTREQARAADISDKPVAHGCVCYGQYED